MQSRKVAPTRRNPAMKEMKMIAIDNIKAKPVQISGKGWDVEVTMLDGGIRLLCAGRAPYTLAQAKTAASSALRDAARHGADSLDFS